MPRMLSQSWLRFLTEGLPTREGSWVIYSQPANLTLRNNQAVLAVRGFASQELVLGSEHFSPAYLGTPYTLILSNGLTLQLYTTQGGALPLPLAERLFKFGLVIPAVASYSQNRTLREMLTAREPVQLAA